MRTLIFVSLDKKSCIYSQENGSFVAYVAGSGAYGVKYFHRTLAGALRRLGV